MNVTRIFAAVFLAGLVCNPATAYQSSSQSFAFGNDRTESVRAPAVSTNGLTFVDMLSYLPSDDDDFCFQIVDTGDGDYYIQTANGNEGSTVNFVLNNWQLPDYVGWERKYLTLEGKTAHSAVSFTVPSEHECITIIELLSYWPGGDDDLAYATRAVAIGRTVIVTAICDFGRVGSSSIVLRATVLYWHRDMDVRYEIHRLVATEGGGMYATFTSSGRWLATPTAYMTDTSKYAYGSFESLIASTSHASAAGKSVDTFGAVKDAASLGAAIAQANVPSIAWSLGSSLYKYLRLGLGPDDRDDDFWMNLSSSHAGSDRRVDLEIGHGNKYSLAEATVWSLSFP